MVSLDFLEETLHCLHPERYAGTLLMGDFNADQLQSNTNSKFSGVSWGVHSVRLHPGGSKRGAKKEGRKRKKQGKGEKKRERKGAPKKERREGKENMQKKRKRGKKSKENRI